MTPFYGWDSTALRLQKHWEQEVYFLPLSSQKSLTYSKSILFPVNI